MSWNTRSWRGSGTLASYSTRRNWTRISRACFLGSRCWGRSKLLGHTCQKHGLSTDLIRHCSTSGYLPAQLPLELIWRSNSAIGLERLLLSSTRSLQTTHFHINQLSELSASDMVCFHKWTWHEGWKRWLRSNKAIRLQLYEAKVKNRNFQNHLNGDELIIKLTSTTVCCWPTPLIVELETIIQRTKLEFVEQRWATSNRWGRWNSCCSF